MEDRQALLERPVLTVVQLGQLDFPGRQGKLVRLALLDQQATLDQLVRQAAQVRQE